MKVMDNLVCSYSSLLWIIGLVHAIYGSRVQEPIAFRTRSSSLSYIFPKTETTTQAVINVGFSTPKCDGQILAIPSRDLQQHYYSVKLKSSTTLVFDYQILDGLFSIRLKAQATKSFCDGRRHYVSLRKHGRTVYYQVDGGQAYTHVEDNFIQKPSLSKPDGIFLGGDKDDKFIGCIYNATIEIHWSKLPITYLDLIQMYLNGDRRVSSKDLFVGACVDKGAECQPTRSKIFVTKPNGWIASPIVPDKPKRCSWVLSAPRKRRVKLELHLLRVNDSFHCVDNRVQIMEGRVEGRQVIGRYCNPNLESPLVLYSEGRFLTVVLQVTNPRDPIEFLAKYTIARLKEGPCPVLRDLRSSHGSLTSPDFPYSYGNSRKCTWHITVPRGLHVLITFHRGEFHIDGCSAECRCDYLVIHAENEQGRLSSFGKYCGNAPPSPVYVRERRVQIEFASDSEDSQRGFRAVYTAIKPMEEQCPKYKKLQNTTGTITSPRYPLIYPGDMDCFWHIKGPPGSRINLTFTAPLFLDFNCTDYLEVADSARKRTRSFVKKLCSTIEVPATVSSNRNELFVRFSSDKYQRLNVVRMGFAAKYEILTAKTLARVSGAQALQFSVMMLWTTVFVVYGMVYPRE